MSRTVSFGGQVWILPGYVDETAVGPAKCKSCGADILWVLTKKGFRAPINQDGVSHFATCPQAAGWGGHSTVGG